MVIKTCLTCGCEYEVNSKYCNNQTEKSKYCSNYCRLHRKHDKKPLETKICQYCGNKYFLNINFSNIQKLQSKFCSSKCSGKSRKIEDGLTNNERYARKIGLPKQGSPEYYKKLNEKTKEAMHRPEVNAKLHKSRRPTSLEARMRHSDLLVGKMPKNLNDKRFGNVKRGVYNINGKEIFFRSKWEANYALYLDFLIKNKQIKSWEYEAKVFIFEAIKLGTRSYRPDFKVYNNDGTTEWHEVKGYMDEKKQSKIKKI